MPVIPRRSATASFSRHGSHALAGPPAEDSVTLPPSKTAALDRITADSLKGHLSFLASDLLEGRDTPSRGLDLAAEYIAAQFRRAGLEAIGDDGYFQTANWELAETAAERLCLRDEEWRTIQPIRVGKELVSLQRLRGFDVPAAPIFKIDAARREGPRVADSPSRSKARRCFAELPGRRFERPGRDQGGHARS